MKTLLIYIPSYTDYLLAKDNIVRLRKDFSKSRFNRNFDVQVSISINGVQLSEEEILEFKEITNYFKLYNANISGETNILQGYLQALEIQPDYFWIMSSNEFIQPMALDYLFNMVELYPNADLFVANAQNRFRELRISNIFKDLEREKSSIGLITSTIYRFKTTYDKYTVSQKWNWTGWGHLAVIQSIVSSPDFSSLIEFPDHELFTQPHAYIRDRDPHLEKSIIEMYHNSFFTYPLLAAYFLKNSKLDFAIFIFHWIKKSWYKISYFRFRGKTDPYAAKTYLDPLLVESLSLFAIRKVNLAAFLSIKFFSILPIYLFRKNKFMKYLYKKYKALINEN
jgi:hypothetical protein